MHRAKRGEQPRAASGERAEEQPEAATERLKIRICIGCRQRRYINELLRITADYKSPSVFVNAPGSKIFGRSAYICRQPSCLTKALNGTKLKAALEGRRVAGRSKRSISWPLEPQLMQVIASQCAETSKTCQNTQEAAKYSAKEN